MSLGKENYESRIIKRRGSEIHVAVRKKKYKVYINFKKFIICLPFKKKFVTTLNFFRSNKIKILVSLTIY